MAKNKIRYGIVGLGHITQTAVLPAFQNCKNSKLTALISNDEKKRKVLGKKYKIEDTYSYDEFEKCLDSGIVDAVYIALPNHLHKEYTVRAAQAGVHVLCEKPMALNTEECEEMIQACDANRVKLMIAYRLHFEPANLKAIEFVHDKKKIGEPKIFQSIHSQATNFPNIRTLPTKQGGGPTYDVGVYDINAARYLFQDEPISVFAEATQSNIPQLKSIEESVSVILRFPKNRLASIIYSYGTADTDTFRIAGTAGDLSLDPAYTYHGEKRLTLTIEEKKSEKIFKPSDHFAPEIDYFSECIQKNRNPEPSGLEGLADVQVIEGIFKSLETHNVIELSPIRKKERPNIRQKIERPAIKPPEVIRAEKPSKKKAA